MPYVDCYLEHETPARLAIETVNGLLWGVFGGEGGPMADRSGLTVRARVRIDWLGRVRLQVEVCVSHLGRGWPAPPKIGQPDSRPTHTV